MLRFSVGMEENVRKLRGGGGVNCMKGSGEKIKRKVIYKTRDCWRKKKTGQTKE